MLDRAAILRLIPHQGAMCLLDGVRSWTARRIACFARSHLDPANPLRRGGMLPAVCGGEYGLQAAAVHGALTAGLTAAGRVAALELSLIAVPRLDDPLLGAVLEVEAVLELADAGGIIYGFSVHGADGRRLLDGRGTVMFPHAAPASA